MLEGMTFEERLRGATLDRVSVNWRDGVALVSFFPSPTSAETMHMCTLRAEGVTRLDVARGASGSRVVRAVAHVPGKAGAHGRVEVTTEDGESVRVEAATFHIDPTDI
jgi:hypothetical protein